MYPRKLIVIVDDNSDYNYVRAEFEYRNVRIVQSEYPKRGELLPYIYFLKHKFFTNAVILHDSVFFHRRISFENLIANNTAVLPLWCFTSDTENLSNTQRMIRRLINYQTLQSNLSMEKLLIGMMPTGKWNGCFGVQSFINLRFLENIERKYRITNLVTVVHSRADRCCLERIFGCIFSIESPKALREKSLLGNIMTYQTWGYTYDQYMEDFRNGSPPKMVVKVWTGR